MNKIQLSSLNNELSDNENEIMKKSKEKISTVETEENENMNKSYISKFQYMDK